MDYTALLLFLGAIFLLLIGYPVAFSLAGTGLFFALVGIVLGRFDPSFLEAIPNRFYTSMTNEIFISIPMFIFMGSVLERSKIADELLNTMGLLFGPLRGGLAISVTLVGMLMAASTGIVGATVVTMGLLSLPTMIKKNYNVRIAAGTICASGTLGQIIPPSIVLILLGDVISSAYQKSQLDQGIFSPRAISVGDLFLGALFPGLLLVFFYVLYLVIIAVFKGSWVPAMPIEDRREFLANTRFFFTIVKVLFPPILLIVVVLGSILIGLATPTEASAVGSVGALLIALFKKKINYSLLKEVMYNTTFQTSMVFFILLGASIFSLVFRGFGGDDLVHDLLSKMPGGVFGSFMGVMLLMFFLGFFIDFIEITFVVVPIVAPVLMAMGLDPIWLGVIIGLNLQTSFLTPPFGFSLFYLRGVAPDTVSTKDIYLGVIPFIIIQLIVLVVVYHYQGLVTWLPLKVYGS